MKLPVTTITLAIAGGVATPSFAAGDFPLPSCKSWNGTVVERSGVDTRRAEMKGIITEADIQEYCERDPGGETTAYGGKWTIRECTTHYLEEVRGVKLVARANCEQAVLDFDYGSRSKRVRFPVQDTSCSSANP